MIHLQPQNRKITFIKRKLFFSIVFLGFINATTVGEKTLPTNTITSPKLVAYNIPYLEKDFVGFKEALAFKESQGKYTAVNTFGYLGKYQFGKTTLLRFKIYNTKAFLNQNEITVSDYSKKNQSTLVTGIPAKTHYSDEEFKNMINDFQDWKKVRMIGSAAMASIYVAAGKAETYKENGIFLWDIAAGAAIVEAAGGVASIKNIQADYRVDAIFTNQHLAN